MEGTTHKNMNMIVNRRFACKFKAYAAQLGITMPKLFEDTFNTIMDAIPPRNYDAFIKRLKETTTNLILL
jgi:hypothetical protein